MMEAVTFPESHSFFTCEMGPTKKRVLGREMVKGKGGREGGRGEGTNIHTVVLVKNHMNT